jgi:diadenylate cyclase
VSWLLDSIRWTDLLDIGMMAYIIYRALLILRGTRAIQSLAGLVVLILLYAGADWLDLVSIHWLLEKFFVYIVLAVIILFQQDIRRGLARAGGRLFFVSGRRTTDLSMLEELVRASFAMASRRVGALIAIERGASLDEYVESASILDARVSHDLLLSVFHPTSPLHDGAVIIQKNRVAAAQAFLPLTQSKSVSRFFGTRHRAGIGLTEETDAIVIIVSEERGAVSLVEGGTLRPASDANELREALQRVFQAADEPDKPPPVEDAP